MILLKLTKTQDYFALDSYDEYKYETNTNAGYYGRSPYHRSRRMSYLFGEEYLTSIQ